VQKNSLKECAFVNSALEIQCYVAKIHSYSCFLAILPTGKEDFYKMTTQILYLLTNFVKFSECVFIKVFLRQISTKQKMSRQATFLAPNAQWNSIIMI